MPGLTASPTLAASAAKLLRRYTRQPPATAALAAFSPFSYTASHSSVGKHRFFSDLAHRRHAVHAAPAPQGNRPTEPLFSPQIPGSARNSLGSVFPSTTIAAAPSNPRAASATGFFHCTLPILPFPFAQSLRYKCIALVFSRFSSFLDPRNSQSLSNSSSSSSSSCRRSKCRQGVAAEAADMTAEKRKSEVDVEEATSEDSPLKKAAVASDAAAAASDNLAAAAAATVPQPQQQEVVEPLLCLRVKRLSDKAVLPSRGSSGAAGYDLSSAYDVTVPARGKAMAKTDLSIAIPEGTYARVAPRSGLAWKHSIDVGAGVVDYDYRGNVGVILFNLSDTDFHVKAGDRVAQLILERIVTPPVLELDELDNTARGAGGFGSTGVALKGAEVAQNSRDSEQGKDGNQ